MLAQQNDSDLGVKPAGLTIQEILTNELLRGGNDQ
jgi:hypothetical protein